MTIVLAWMIPITRAEAEFAATEGWESFEDVLARSDPDLLDMHRVSVV